MYVDGFNLYYGALKDTQYKWLDLLKLCKYLLPQNDTRKIKYFTTRIRARPHDPSQLTRQQICLRALRTIPNLEIIYGHFLTHEVKMPLATPTPGCPNFVKVLKTEEKGSDVNIASHLIFDGCKGEYDVAVVMSNDSNLREPIRIVKEELGLPVGIVIPYRQRMSKELSKIASFVRKIRKSALGKSQFPETLRDAHGTFHKPEQW